MLHRITLHKLSKKGNLSSNKNQEILHDVTQKYKHGNFLCRSLLKNFYCNSGQNYDCYTIILPALQFVI
jgi:hypothetical protein